MRQLRQILSGEAALAGLLDRRRSEITLLEQVRKSLPPALAAQTDVANASPPELVLVAWSGAAAALLRHRGPELLKTLAGKGWKFTGIRVRVQARPRSPDRRKVIAKQLDETSATALRAGADRVSDPRLAAALRRLADQGCASSGDEHQPFEGVEHQHPEQKK